MAAGWADRIVYARTDAEDRLGLTAVLVRPDGVAAWVAETTPNLDEVARLAARWFGGRDAPAHQPADRQKIDRLEPPGSAPANGSGSFEMASKKS